MRLLNVQWLILLAVVAMIFMLEEDADGYVRSRIMRLRVERR